MKRATRDDKQKIDTLEMDLKELSKTNADLSIAAKRSKLEVIKLREVASRKPSIPVSKSDETKVKSASSRADSFASSDTEDGVEVVSGSEKTFVSKVEQVNTLKNQLHLAEKQVIFDVFT